MSKRNIAPVTIDGKTIWIEVSDIEIEDEGVIGKSGEHPRDLRPSATPTGPAADRLRNIVTDVGETIEAIVDTIGKGLDKVKPDQWSVEFSIGFAGKNKIPYLAEGTVNGGVKVSATWKKASE